MDVGTLEKANWELFQFVAPVVPHISRTVSNNREQWGDGLDGLHAHPSLYIRFEAHPS